MGAPVTLSGANAPTPTFIAPIVTSDTVLGFSLKVMDDHGAISTNPAVVYVMIKHANNTHTSTTAPSASIGLNQQVVPHLSTTPNDLQDTLYHRTH